MKKLKKILLIISLIINFTILFYFKYYNFISENINYIIPNSLPYLNIALPIGISFYTFQATSYIIDIYRGKIKNNPSFFNFIIYLTLFPQLIAGPIERYKKIGQEINKRNIKLNEVAKGIERFILGLAKKVMIANLLGELSSTLLQTSPSILSYWLQAIANTLQIYFDFSGYSDMAIGLGLILGFHFLENFNYPMIAKNITDFWRRWHISLSSWFRDYLYIPLGGNKVTKYRHFFNIALVWLATGLWHGASWNFILWGIYFCLFLILEKTFLLSYLKKHPIISHIYTILVIIFSFVLFTQTNLSNLIIFINGMIGRLNIPIYNIETIFYLKNYFVILIISIICATPIIKHIYRRIIRNKYMKHLINFIEPFLYLTIFLVCTAFIIDESFQSFIYFRF